MFHYAGHTDVTDGQGTLVHRVRAATLEAFDEAVGRTAARSVIVPGPMEAVAKPAAWSSSEVLAARLARGRTRLAVFNACNRGPWPFVQPLMRAGIPAVIGVQGLVSEVVAYVEGFRSAHKVVRYRDDAHLRSILDSEILKAGETLHDALKPRVVILLTSPDRTPRPRRIHF